jgi:ABC-type lipoprotein export system ATPase subunit
MTIIYGASGSGKSSLLNVLSGLQEPTKGQLRYNSESLYDLSANELAYYRAHELGIVYQNNYWVKSLSVLDNVALPLYFIGESRAQAQQKARLALERVHMQEYASKLPQFLSGGEQQRVAMARAIVNDPPIIIADEPTGNLDSKNGDRIIKVLTDFNSIHGKTIILVTHNMEYLPLANHLLEIQDGRVTEIDAKAIPKTISSIIKETQARLTHFHDKEAEDV